MNVADVVSYVPLVLSAWWALSIPVALLVGRLIAFGAAEPAFEPAKQQTAGASWLPPRFSKGV